MLTAAQQVVLQHIHRHVAVERNSNTARRACQTWLAESVPCDVAASFGWGRCGSCNSAGCSCCDVAVSLPHTTGCSIQMEQGANWQQAAHGTPIVLRICTTVLLKPHCTVEMAAGEARSGGVLGGRRQAAIEQHATAPIRPPVET